MEGAAEEAAKAILDLSVDGSSSETTSKKWVFRTIILCVFPEKIQENPVKMEALCFVFWLQIVAMWN